MSGHSKWSTIKHKKALNDAKKGKVFSKYAQLITASARDGGGDLNMNPTLRLLVDKAKAESMPMENIKRAIERGAGSGDGASVIFESASYEGFGPSGVQIIVDVLTENKNRTVSEIRNIFSENGGNMGESGAVSWNFEQKGLIIVRCGKIIKSEKFGAPDTIQPVNKETVMLGIMNFEGVIDIQDEELEEGEGLVIYTQVDKLGYVRDEILKLQYVVKSADLVKMPKILKALTKEELERAISFIETLEDYEDVQNVWTDIDPACYELISE